MSDACPGSVLITTSPVPAPSTSNPEFASGVAFACAVAGGEAGAEGSGTGILGCEFVGSVRSVSGVVVFVTFNTGAAIVTSRLLRTVGLESL